VFRLADALLRSGRVGESIPLFARVVAGRPRSADPFVGLATAYARTGKMAQAKKALEGALTVDPGNGQAQFSLGDMARARGDEAEARSRYEKARLDPVTKARAESRLAEGHEASSSSHGRKRRPVAVVRVLMAAFAGAFCFLPRFTT
jgi:Flp pilus assembly protein TadD